MGSLPADSSRLAGGNRLVVVVDIPLAVVGSRLVVAGSSVADSLVAGDSIRSDLARVLGVEGRESCFAVRWLGPRRRCRRVVG